MTAAFTDTVPFIWGQRPADPAWGRLTRSSAGIMYEQYGDRRILEENFEGLKKYVEHLRSKAPEHLLQIGHYGDWVAIEPTPTLFVSACTTMMSAPTGEDAQVLGRAADAERYGNWRNKSKKQSTRSTSTPKPAIMLMARRRQTRWPCSSTWLPEGQRTAGNLQNDIVYRHNTHVTTGIIGTKYLFPTLTKLGRPNWPLNCHPDDLSRVGDTCGTEGQPFGSCGRSGSDLP